MANLGYLLPANPTVAPQTQVRLKLIDNGDGTFSFGTGGLASTAVPAAVANGLRVEPYYDEYGRLHVVSDPSNLPSYAAAVVALAPAVAATDIYTITGSATKTVRVRRVAISAVATAAGAYVFQLIKRSAANTGGTSSAPTVVPLDSAFVAGTATVLAYTANPTPGATVGIVSVKRATVTTAAGAIPQVIWEFDLSENPVVLRGIAQVLALSLNGATMTGGLADISCMWTEE